MKKYREPRKKEFKLYYDNELNVLEELSDEELGKYYRAIVMYEIYGEDMEVADRTIRTLVNATKRDLDRKMGAYRSTCERNKRNRAKGHQSSPVAPVVTNGTNTDTDTDTHTDTKHINNAQVRTTSKKEIDEVFEALWKLYPEKKGKGRVSDSKRKALYDIGAEEMKRTISRYQEELKKDNWRKPQNGSTFFNSGYIDYLDANYNQQEINEQERKIYDF